ncbi:MAG: PspC domain-containing protein [Acidimicrobiia bacterium]|nr:PspC domain-containing protein [Acidimicrobiia bacterium]
MSDEGSAMARRDNRIYRDTSDQKIAGVCSGLARYFDIDTALMRVGFVVFSIFGGVTLLAYPILWWVMEPAPAHYWDDDTEHTIDLSETTEDTEQEDNTGHQP